MKDLATGRSYGDVLLVPQRSPVDSRADVDLSTPLTPNITLERPLLSAPMDTVTERETAIALSRAGGFGTIHRFLAIEEQAAEIRAVVERGERVGAAVGIADGALDRTEHALEAGATAIVVDVAHAHLERALDAVETIADEYDPDDLIVGNVATGRAVEDLYTAGADAVKVGIGPGSHCTTRRVAGAGVPQLTAVDRCAEVASSLNVPIIADGGIQSSGDAVKALMAGADTVMLGRLFAGTDESPGSIIEVDGEEYKRSRGMATTAAAQDRTDKETDGPDADEGVEALTPYSGRLIDVVDRFAAGIRSGLSYCGGHTIPEARASAEFMAVEASAREREGAHFDHDWESVVTDDVD
ncbi:MAG: guanosine monophosphate reductase [Halorhabdus sp.]